MSTENNHKLSPKTDHGATGSYIIGYILSLIFTFIPYYLVVNHVLTGDLLLVTILGIAVLQMIIQIFFFLHLGRGPKPLYNVIFFFATAGLIILVIGASLFIMSNLYHNMTPEEAVVRQAQREGIAQIGGEETGACLGKEDNHVVVIKDGVAEPNHVDAKRCDTLSFVNEDGGVRDIRFGIYPQGTSYGGEFEVVLDDERAETINLNQTGDYRYFDNNNPSMTGSFFVRKDEAAN